MPAIEEGNAALCRKDLDLFSEPNLELLTERPCDNVTWLKIEGIADFWRADSQISLCDLAYNLLSSLARYDTVLYYLIVGDYAGIALYMGLSGSLSTCLHHLLASLFPGIVISATAESPLRDAPANYGGVATGIPTAKSDKDLFGYQIENICRGMLGKPFSYLVRCKGLSSLGTTFANNTLMTESEETYAQLKQTYFGGAQGNITAERIDYKAQEYLENLAIEQEIIREALSSGLWQVSVYYGASSATDSVLLGNIIKSSFSGKDSKPEPVRVTQLSGIQEVFRCGAAINNPSPVVAQHPLGYTRLSNGKSVPLCNLQFSTLMSSRQLAAFCQLPTKEFPGYYVDQYVEFDNAERIPHDNDELITLGDIQIAGRGCFGKVWNPYELSKNDLSRHALVIGITGGGKTNTSKSLLAKLWSPQNAEKKIPFLVIESAKREYWELRNLRGFEDLLVFTLGDEASDTAISYRINPFETPAGISLQTHIDYLLATFKAAFELYPPMPYVLETAVYEVYSDLGWDIVENKNTYGLTGYPTLENLYNKIDVVVDRLGYESEVQSNVKAALKARIGSLMIGGKGAMLNTKKSVPIGELLEKPVVMELEDIGDDETKSFVIGILLVQLYEYRKASMKTVRKDFLHLLVVEEAHRLLKNVPPGGESGSTQAKSVEFFCNMLAEIRTYGQGIMIADQIPTKLAPDTIKNTNLKIVHRTVALDDREAIGQAMNMSDEQIGYLSSLPRGTAAVYAEGDNRPKCVKMPLVETYYNKSRGEAVREMQNKVYRLTHRFSRFNKHHRGCSFCEKKCLFWEHISNNITEKIPGKHVIAQQWKELNYVSEELRAVVQIAYKKGVLDEERRGIAQEVCLIGCLLETDHSLREGDKELILAKYLKAFYSSEKEK